MQKTSKSEETKEIWLRSITNTLIMLIHTAINLNVHFTCSSSVNCKFLRVCFTSLQMILTPDYMVESNSSTWLLFWNTQYLTTPPLSNRSFLSLTVTSGAAAAFHKACSDPLQCTARTFNATSAQDSKVRCPLHWWYFWFPLIVHVCAHVQPKGNNCLIRWRLPAVLS